MKKRFSIVFALAFLLTSTLVAFADSGRPANRVEINEAARNPSAVTGIVAGQSPELAARTVTQVLVRIRTNARRQRLSPEAVQQLISDVLAAAISQMDAEALGTFVEALGAEIAATGSIARSPTLVNQVIAGVSSAMAADFSNIFVSTLIAGGVEVPEPPTTGDEAGEPPVEPPEPTTDPGPAPGGAPAPIPPPVGPGYGGQGI